MSTLSSTFVAVPEKVATGWLDRVLSLLTVKAPKPQEALDPIEAYIHANGGVLTDQMERDISRRFGSIVGG